MDVTFTYTKKRELFGMPLELADIPAELIHVVERAPPLEDQLLFSNPSILECDLTAELSEHSAGTERIMLSSKGMHHYEGGWPKEVDPDDLEAKARFRKKARAGAIPECLKQIGPVVSESVKQNRTVDLYEELFQGEMEDHSSEPPSAKNMTKIKDPNTIKRQVTHVSWDPEGKQKFAVSYANMNFQDPRYVHDSIPTASYIWDLNNPNVPDLELTPASPLSFIQYNKTSDSLVAGSYNGLVSFFDLRKSGGTPCETSVIENSHHDPVYSVQWIQSKTGTNCASVSTDGRMLTWDVRRLGEPMDVVELLDDSGQLLGGSSMTYLQEAGPTKFLVGTEQGVVVNINNKKQKGGNILTVYDQTGGKHHSPIYAIERNPIHPKFFLTVGDWTTRIWTEELKTPIMITQYHNHYLTSGTWSPSRAGVFFVTTVDGTLDVWDFYHTQSEVSYSHRVSEASLSAIALQVGQRGSVGRLVAVGDADGVVHLLEVSDSLAVPRSNEKVAIAGMLDRETKREKNLVARMKDMTRRQQAAALQQHAQQPSPASGSEGERARETESQTALLQSVESDFLKLIHEAEQQQQQQQPAEAVAPLEEKYRPAPKSRVGKAELGGEAPGLPGSSEADLGVDLMHRLPEAEPEVTSFMARSESAGEREAPSALPGAETEKGEESEERTGEREAPGASPGAEEAEASLPSMAAEDEAESLRPSPEEALPEPSQEVASAEAFERPETESHPEGEEAPEEESAALPAPEEEFDPDQALLPEGEEATPPTEVKKEEEFDPNQALYPEEYVAVVAPPQEEAPPAPEEAVGRAEASPGSSGSSGLPGPRAPTPPAGASAGAVEPVESTGEFADDFPAD